MICARCSTKVSALPHVLAHEPDDIYVRVAGVHKSDVLVILATKGVLTRPWCLMEMWEAAVNQIPIVLLPVVGIDWTQVPR